MQTYSAIWSKQLGADIARLCPEPYTAELVGEDAKAVEAAVNQGIDSHLEACYLPARGDCYKWKGSRLVCVISRESLVVLVRRLLEAGDETSLASSICFTLGVELI